MAAKRKGNSEFKNKQPVEIKPGSLTPDSVDALVSGFLAELTDISSEMQQRGIPAGDEIAHDSKQNKMLLREDLDEAVPSGSKPGWERSVREADDIPTELDPSEPAGHSATDPQKPAPASAPAPSHKQTATAAISQPLAQPSDARPTPGAEEYAWERLDSLRNHVVSSGWIRWRRKTLFIVPIAMLAVILGFFFYPGTAKKLPGPKADAQIPANLNVRTRAATGGTVLRNDQGDHSPLSPEKRIDSSRPSSTTIQEAAAAKPHLSIEQPNASRSISKPKSPPVSRSERLTEPGSELSASLAPKIQDGANPQNKTPAVALPPPSPSPERTSPGIDVGSQARGNPEIPKVAPGGPVGMPPADGASRDLSPGGAQREPAGNADAKNVAIKSESAIVPRVPPVAAQLLVKVVPDYPTLARIQKVGGVVELEANINEKGDVVRADAVAGPTLLRAAAEQALLKWKFKPASINGVAVASRTRVSMVFEMK